MARSTNIYYFQHSINLKILAAFTVKHEAQLWYNSIDIDENVIRAYRIHDGAMRDSNYEREHRVLKIVCSPLTDVTEDFKS